MTPWYKERIVRKSAEWMWWSQRGKSPIWWYAPDLTDKNPDKSNPLLSLDDAEVVFSELKKRDLVRLTSTEFYRKVNGTEEKHEMLVFLIQLHKERDWEKLITKGFFGIYCSPIFKKFGGVLLLCCYSFSQQLAVVFSLK